MPASKERRRPAPGATMTGPQSVSFRVWAPGSNDVSVKIVSAGATAEIPLNKDPMGYFEGVAKGVRPGDLYFYVLDHDHRYPDPASRFQPNGVHGASQVVDPAEFLWEDTGWKGISLKDFIIYEMHIGTFTKEGTFGAVIPLLDSLVDLGITAVELMPVAQFPGHRNWGYDGVYPFAPQNSYGGPTGLKELINSAHKKGLAVILDVVYNHLGPEGNYLGHYAPYFTDRYRTPWGDAINFDGPHSDEVRRFFIDNAIYWIEEFHVDGLRLDAVHGIFDFSALHFLRELRDCVRLQAERMGREIPVIAESDLNDVRVINPPEIGGHGLDAQWDDDFHHALHTLVTDERMGYYADFGKPAQLEKVFREGFAYTGQYSRFRKRRHGNSPKGRPSSQFIVFSQSHDQVGNRMAGDRTSLTLSFEQLKLAAGVVIFSPFVPLIFMGEEYGETAPFRYFTSHSDNDLGRAVRQGREKEFASFKWNGEVPDPQDEKTFIDSRLNRHLFREGTHGILFTFYRELIGLRKDIPVLRDPVNENMEATTLDDKAFYVRRWVSGDEVFILYNFGGDTLRSSLQLHREKWEKVLESSAKQWGGGGEHAPEIIDRQDGSLPLVLAPHSFALYRTVGKRK